MFFIIVLGPALAVIALVIGYIYWTFYFGVLLWDKAKDCTEKRNFRIIIMFIGILGLLVVSLVALVIVAVLGSIFLTLLYIWMFI